MSKPKEEKTEESSASLGVSTTTPVSFYFEENVYLEQMLILAENGAGVRSEMQPPVGSVLPVAFRLSTAEEMIRCKAEVLAPVPTSPRALELREHMSEAAFKTLLSNKMGESATAIIKTSDLKKMKEAHEQKKKQKAKEARAYKLPQGFCLRFVDLSPAGLRLIKRHIKISDKLREDLVARDSGTAPSLKDEGQLMGQPFDAGDLSKRAMDW